MWNPNTVLKLQVMKIAFSNVDASIDWRILASWRNNEVPKSCKRWIAFKTSRVVDCDIEGMCNIYLYFHILQFILIHIDHIDILGSFTFFSILVILVYLSILGCLYKYVAYLMSLFRLFIFWLAKHAMILLIQNWGLRWPKSSAQMLLVRRISCWGKLYKSNCLYK